MITHVQNIVILHNFSMHSLFLYENFSRADFLDNFTYFRKPSVHNKNDIVSFGVFVPVPAAYEQHFEYYFVIVRVMSDLFPQNRNELDKKCFTCDCMMFFDFQERELQ